MASDNERRGLCLSCKHAPECTYPRSSDQPVTQCEEFECDGPQRAGTAGRTPSHALLSEEYG